MERDEWQPISTAPKDVPIIVADHESVAVAKYVIDKGEELVPARPDPYWEAYDHSYWEFQAYDKWFEPTQWMPLPEPHKTAKNQP